ncbi:hypothetical protein MOQ_010042 [Trypanosoma cruzi marinkellei]|uniref:Uncharacterized protein n=1 Tax=Trypanosoma cruzi marinkellei TaxID=85056 RepID=K2LU69_TRYCR|nr:hypothetical protein MOQ_010042 [Trypanosoma cruzi marinkellei]
MHACTCLWRDVWSSFPPFPPSASVRRAGMTCWVVGGGGTAYGVRGKVTGAAGGCGNRGAPPTRGGFAAGMSRREWRCSKSCRPSKGIRSEVVLTPATLLRRLEIIFPMAPRATDLSDGATCRGGNSDAHVGQMPALSGGLSGVPDDVRACCHQVPWERVVLRRAGHAPASDMGRNSSLGVLHTTASVYDVMVPSSFCFLPGETSRTPSLARMEKGGCDDNEAEMPLDAMHVAGETCHRLHHDRTVLLFTRCPDSKSRSVWCQRVGVLHHIPGLPDPSASLLTLREYVDFIKSFSQPVGQLKMHCLTTCGRNNRDAANHSIWERLEDAKGGNRHAKEGMTAECRVLRGAVGVWIIDPWHESVFFALRYHLGVEHYEWVCCPQHTLCQEGYSPSANPVASMTLEPKRILLSGRRERHGGPSFFWARASLQRALLEPSPPPHDHSNELSQQSSKRRKTRREGRKTEEDVLSTVLYYCVAGTALGAEEKSTFLTRLLDCDDDVVRLARVWAPLPRSSRPLRGRQILTKPDALAEALKYGLLRLLP